MDESNYYAHDESPFAVSDELKGESLDPETVSYFREVCTMLEGEADDHPDVDRELVIERALEESRSREYRLCVNRTGSAALERILVLCSGVECRRFLAAISEMVLALATDRIASHVLEVILGRSNELLDSSRDSEDDEDVPSFEGLLLGFAEKMSQDVLTLACDPAATHVLRMLIRVLGGLLPRAPRPGRGRHSATPVMEKPHRIVSPTSKKALALLVDGLRNCESYQMVEACSSCQGSASLQELLRVFSAHGESSSIREVVASIFQWENNAGPRVRADVPEDLDKLFVQMISDRGSSHLIELVLQVSPADLLMQLLVVYFRSRLLTLCDGIASNHVVQRLLESLRDIAQAQLCVAELMPSVGDLFQRNRSGVVMKMVKVCSRFGCHAKDMLRSICRVMEVSDPARDKTLAARLLQMDVPDSIAVSSTGALLLQSLLALPSSASKLVVDSVMQLEPSRLVAVAGDRVGSRVIEAMLSSEALPAKTRGKLIDAMSGSFLALAISPYGSFCVEKLFAGADLTRKQKIAAELVKGERELSGSRSGSVVLRKCRISEYQKNKTGWDNTARKQENIRSAFADILSKEAPALYLKPALEQLGVAPADAADGHETRKPLEKKMKKTKKKKPVSATEGLTAEELEADMAKTDGFGEATSEINHLFRSERKRVAAQPDDNAEGAHIKSIKKSKKRAREQAAAEALKPTISKPIDDLADVLDVLKATKRKRGRKSKSADEPVAVLKVKKSKLKASKESKSTVVEEQAPPPPVVKAKKTKSNKKSRIVVEEETDVVAVKKSKRSKRSAEADSGVEDAKKTKKKKKTKSVVMEA